MANYSKKDPALIKATKDTRKKTEEPQQLFTLEIVDKSAPAYLPKLAKEFWKKNIDLLSESQMLKATDIQVFELLCKAYADYRYFSERVEQERTTGTWTIDQETKLTNLFTRAMKAYSDLAAKLGMTSVDRARVVNTAANTDDDEFSKFD